MRVRILAMLLVASCPLTAVAEEPFVYESFAGVQIGRVFLSQSQRDALDAARLLPPAVGTAESSDTAQPEAASRSIRPAGYIIGSGGRSRVWKDGDFVETDSDVSRSTAFPGAIRITRHSRTPQQPERDATASGGEDGAD